MVAHARRLFRVELLKNIFFSMMQGSYVPNLVKIGPYIMSLIYNHPTRERER